MDIHGDDVIRPWRIGFLGWGVGGGGEIGVHRKILKQKLDVFRITRLELRSVESDQKKRDMDISFNQPYKTGV